MRHILTILGLTFVVALSFPDSSWAACKFNWSKGAYCGPGRTATRIGDTFLGPFTNACRTHDWCYFSGGEQVVKEIEEGHLKSRSDKKNRRNGIRRDCDSLFKEELLQACSQVRGSMKRNCQSSAKAYYRAVRTTGWAAFKGSMNRAEDCR